jgi:hypothetical protein
MKNIIIASIVALSGLFGPGRLLAQDNAPERKAEQQAIRQDLLKKIELLKHEKLVKALALDEETAPKFFALYKPAEQDIQSLVRERNDELKKLGLMMNGAKSDADVDPEMQKIRDLNQQIDGREQKLDTDLKGVLSPRQRARLLVFEHEFNQRVRQEVAKHQLQKEAKAIRQKLREQRIQNQLLKKKLQNKAAER